MSNFWTYKNQRENLVIVLNLELSRRRTLLCQRN